jgi:hypothetical protein
MTAPETPDGYAPPAGMPLPPQRLQCAACITSVRAFEAANEAAINEAMLKAAATRTPVIAHLDPALLARMPRLMEAVTIATVPGHGPAAVCAGHTPAVADPGRAPLLVATAGLNMAQFAAPR